MSSQDNGVVALLRRASEDLAPDVEHLVAGGISRGRSRQRRARIGTAVASVAVIGVVGGLAIVVPQLGASPDSAREAGFADGGAKAAAEKERTLRKKLRKAEQALRDQPAPITATLAVGATDFPTTVASLAPGHEIGAPVTEFPYPLVDDEQERVAHFLTDGTLTTVGITPSSAAIEWECHSGEPSATCTQLADGAWQQVWGPTTADQVTAQGVVVWRHGFTVSLLSYNAVEGKDVVPLLAEPALSLDELAVIAESEVWFKTS